MGRELGQRRRFPRCGDLGLARAAVMENSATGVGSTGRKARWDNAFRLLYRAGAGCVAGQGRSARCLAQRDPGAGGVDRLEVVVPA